jgi:hypothetical protein
MNTGDVHLFSHMKPSAVKKAFREAFANMNLPVPECEFWTDPACRNEDEQVERIWLLRSDGMTGAQIAGIRDNVLQNYRNHVGEFSGLREFIVHGRELNLAGEPALDRSGLPIPPDMYRNARTTRHGWEFMGVGDSKTVRLHTRDLRQILVNTVVKRKLDWVFRCTREFELERLAAGETRKSRISCWTVTRIA